LRHYDEDQGRRYGLEHDGELVLFDYTCAYPLGLDSRRFTPSVAEAVRPVLDRKSPDAAIVALAAHADGRFIVQDEDRLEIFELVRWFRLAAGV